MKFYLLLALATGLVEISVSFRLGSKTTGCEISLENLPEKHPLFIIHGTTDLLQPDVGTKTISVGKGEVIELSCAGGDLLINEKSVGQTVEATCSSGNNFKIEGTSARVNDLECSKKVSSVARYSNEKCKTGKDIEIGFEIDSDRFSDQIHVCFDDDTKNAIYAYHHITKTIGVQEVSVARPSFSEGKFYNLGTKLETLYSKNTQRVTINNLVGLEDDSSKYVADGSYYLAKGHLAAKADFVYGAQQTATFYFVNAAPQWQTFNNGNWKILEKNVRDYADDNQLDLIVYTGTYGVSTLPHEETGEEVPLYLYTEEDERAIAIPELFWKVVYNPEAKEGVAILGVNNPYLADVTTSTICKDISSSIDWLTMNKTNEAQGYIYVCAFDEFKKVVKDVPDLDIKSILNK